MSYITAVCFTANERFRLVAQSFCDDEGLLLEGCVNRTSSLIRYIKSLNPQSVIVDGWHNWHSVLEAFRNLYEEIDFLSLPRIYILNDQGLPAIVYSAEDSVLQYVFTGHCGLCPKAEMLSGEISGENKAERATRCFSCGALDDGRGEIIAFLTLPSIHPKNPCINLCNDCLERIWGSYQRLLKRATLELTHGLGVEDEDR